MKKYTQYALIFAVVLALIFVGTNQGLTLYNKSLIVGLYSTADCIPKTTGTHMSLYNYGQISNDGQFYKCNTAGSGTGRYIPETGSVAVCEYHIKLPSIGGYENLLSVYDCPITATASSLNTCTKKQGWTVFGGQVDFTIPAGRQIYINPTSFLGAGKTYLTANIPDYGLLITRSDNYLRYTQDCYSSSMRAVIGNYHPADTTTPLVITPGSPFQVVTATITTASNSQAVSLQRVENGAPIYLVYPAKDGNGYCYRHIVTVKDGTSFVDNAETPICNPTIECIPRFDSGCSDEATVVDITQQNCDANGGVPDGYAAIPGDTSQKCKYTCNLITHKPVPDTLDCQQLVVGGCPADKPYYDITKSACTEVPNMPQEPGLTTQQIIMLIIAAMVITVIIVAIMMKLKK